MNRPRVLVADDHRIVAEGLRGLLEPGDYAEPVDVLNGIAYDAPSDRLFVTGKLWPKLFEIELIPQAKSYLPFVQESPAVEPAALFTR